MAAGNASQTTYTSTNYGCFCCVVLFKSCHGTTQIMALLQFLESYHIEYIN